jgi:hypothetical protein
MTGYQMIEISNQQAHREGSQMALTPRIESGAAGAYTSLNDLAAVVTAAQQSGETRIEAAGQLLNVRRKTPEGASPRYRLRYRFTEHVVEIAASVEGANDARLVMPVIVRPADKVAQTSAQTVRIAKAGGTLQVVVDQPGAFAPLPAGRTFNLVPGFEAVPLLVRLDADAGTVVRLEVLRGNV